MTPRIIHMIFFPWDKEGKLLADQHAFDHRPRDNMRSYAPDFDVRLWTFGDARSFVDSQYPDLWRLMQSLAHPTMMVDVLRWLVVYHFGGIYWQYDLNPLTAMANMLPDDGHEARLFTETEVDDEWRRRSALIPIRQGQPEETLRLCNQAFAAVPRSPFIKKTLDLILERVATLTPKEDYDILYICANAAASTAYYRFGKDDPGVELIDRDQTRRMMKIQYKGTWRTDTGSRKSEVGSRKSEVGSRRAEGALKNIPVVRSAYHRFIKSHSHETHLVISGLRSPVSGLQSLVSRLQLQSVLECSVSGKSVFEGERMEGIDWQMTSPLRKYPNPNPSLDPSPDPNPDYDYEKNTQSSRVSFLNPMYSRLPRVDAMMLVDYLDQIPNADILRIIDRARQAEIRWLISTHYPCLNSNWDTYVGEWRPISLELSPFSLPAPEHCIPVPDPERRPDRVVAVFAI